MKSPRRLGAFLLAAAALAWPTLARAADAQDSLSEADRLCLGCHGAAGLDKTLAHGDKVSLQVDAAAFAKSVHAAVGCAACHGDVDPKKHPANARSFADARAMSIAMVQSCAGCHEDSAKAHQAGVHGRAQDRVSAAPLCVTCHGTHDISRASVGTALRDACLGCHADAPARHDQWLPNTRLHLEVVSCAACHAPTSGKRVELRFYDVGAKQEPVTEARPAAAPSKGEAAPLDEAGLRALVRTVDEGVPGKVLLMGRVEPNAGPEGHRLLPKGEALKECSSCHRKGAAPFQNVSLSVVGSDGQRVRYEAQKEVLHAPTSVESVGGFYAMGGTRIQLLDVLLGLALVGGLSAPIGHFVMRRLMRRKDAAHE